MTKTISLLCLSVFLATQIPSLNGSFCTKTVSYYASVRLCIPQIFLFWVRCGSFYKRFLYYKQIRECCPGFKGKDCNIPICREACRPGYLCSSPDMCTIDPLAFQALNANSTDANSTSTNIAKP